MERHLCVALLAKIDEQIERTDHLAAQVPEGAVDWTPPTPRDFSVGVLLGHLLECLAGFCAVLYAARPQALGHFQDLRRLPVNHRCAPPEARERMAVYRARIGEGFALLEDADLGKAVPTVFVRDGELLLTLLLGNLEHLVNHKHQLFSYLKLMGVEIGSRDLYRFRGNHAS